MSITPIEPFESSPHKFQEWHNLTILTLFLVSTAFTLTMFAKVQDDDVLQNRMYAYGAGLMGGFSFSLLVNKIFDCYNHTTKKKSAKIHPEELISPFLH